MVTPSASDDGRRNERLNGWKEIALHLGKGVRTVQRWEKDLDLPIRRLGTGRGEIVFAFTRELEAWRQAAERGGDLAAKPGEDDPQDPREGAAGEPPGGQSTTPGPLSPSTAQSQSPAAVRPLSGRSILRPSVALTGLALTAALLAAGWWTLGRSPRQPYEVRVENHALRVYDDNGRFLWEHRFEFPLTETPETRAARASHPAEFVRDIDGDGRREVVFATLFEPPGTRGGLYCFDHRGRLRFHHVVNERARFGDIPYTGPWRPVGLTIAPPEPDGTMAIWVSFVDRDQFPAVIQKVSPSGAVLGQFWNDGTTALLEPGTYKGRKVMFAAGPNNEFFGASLAVLDRSHPTGRAPAVAPKFTCTTCPDAAPLAYIVFPGTQIERRQQNSTTVLNLQQNEQGEISLLVAHQFRPDLLGRPGGVMVGHTTYLLTPDLVPLVAHHEPSYRVLHDEAHKLGILDQPFSDADDHLLKILRWNGSAFEDVPRPLPR